MAARGFGVKWADGAGFAKFMARVTPPWASP